MEPSGPSFLWNFYRFSFIHTNDSDILIGCLGSVAPCVLYGSNVERLGSTPGTFANHCLPYTGLYLLGNSLFGWNFLAPWFSYPTRSAMRRKFNLEASYFHDPFCSHQLQEVLSLHICSIYLNFVFVKVIFYPTKGDLMMFFLPLFLWWSGNLWVTSQVMWVLWKLCGRWGATWTVWICMWLGNSCFLPHLCPLPGRSRTSPQDASSWVQCSASFGYDSSWRAGHGPWSLDCVCPYIRL